MEQVTKNIEEFVKSHEIDLCDRFAHEGFQPLVNEMYRQNKGSFNEYGCYTDTRLWTHCYSTMESLAEKQNPILYKQLIGKYRSISRAEAYDIINNFTCLYCDNQAINPRELYLAQVILPEGTSVETPFSIHAFDDLEGRADVLVPCMDLYKFQFFLEKGTDQDVMLKAVDYKTASVIFSATIYRKVADVQSILKEVAK